jgi:phosphoglycerate dehydrogenase-like enzyme
MMRVAILDDYQQVALQLADWRSLDPQVEVKVFPTHIADLDELAQALHAFECVVLMRERTPFPRALFDRLPNLRLLITSGARNAAIDVDAATAHRVQVCGTSLIGFTTSELAWGHIIALFRHILTEDRATREGKWQTTLGFGLAGRTLGVLGLGRLGREMARVGNAFHMEVVAWSPNLTVERANEGGAKLVGKDEFFSRSDAISIHMVLSERTRGLVGATELARMKPTAFLVNTSRGPIVDEAALIAALRERKIAGAGLDVFDVEPLPLDHPLRYLDNVLLTPHLGYVTDENYRHHFPQVVETIRGFLAGKVLKPINNLS